MTKNFIKRGQINLLFVGGLDRAHYFKGLPILLNALLLTTNQRWRLSIVGSGNLMPSYKQQTENLGFKKKVRFLGRLDDVTLVKTYQESDIFILPSINRHEAFGLVLTEAMACGVPVIASELPGVRKVFRDGLDGLNAKPGDTRDLAQKIDALMNNEEKRLEMSRSARSYAVTKYSWAQVEDKLKQVFL